MFFWVNSEKLKNHFKSKSKEEKQQKQEAKKQRKIQALKKELENLKDK